MRIFPPPATSADLPEPVRARPFVSACDWKTTASPGVTIDLASGFPTATTCRPGSSAMAVRAAATSSCTNPTLRRPDRARRRWSSRRVETWSLHEIGLDARVRSGGPAETAGPFRFALSGSPTGRHSTPERRRRTSYACDTRCHHESTIQLAPAGVLAGRRAPVRVVDGDRNPRASYLHRGQAVVQGTRASRGALRPGRAVARPDECATATGARPPLLR